MVIGMAELIDKWEVVNKLIQLENNYQFYKEQWDADVLYRRICELEIGIGKTPGVTVQKWISVYDQMPELSTQVIGLAKRNPFAPLLAMQVVWIGNGWVSPVTGHYLDCYYWMPLPEPPKGE